MGRGDRIADAVARGVGSWGFLMVQTAVLLGWVGLNLLAWSRHWDPYPFILLNLAISVQTAYAAPIILMAQNREAERDRLRHVAEYETDLESRSEIEASQAGALQRVEGKLDLLLAGHRPERNAESDGITRQTAGPSPPRPASGDEGPTVGPEPRT